MQQRHNAGQLSLFARPQSTQLNSTSTPSLHRQLSAAPQLNRRSRSKNSHHTHTDTDTDTDSPPATHTPNGLALAGPHAQARHGAHAAPAARKAHQAAAKGARRRHLHRRPLRHHRARLLPRPARDKAPARVPLRPRLARPLPHRRGLPPPHRGHDHPAPAPRHLLLHPAALRHAPKEQPHGPRRHPHKHPHKHHHHHFFHFFFFHRTRTKGPLRQAPLPRRLPGKIHLRGQRLLQHPPRRAKRKEAQRLRLPLGRQPHPRLPRNRTRKARQSPRPGRSRPGRPHSLNRLERRPQARPKHVEGRAPQHPHVCPRRPRPSPAAAAGHRHSAAAAAAQGPAPKNGRLRKHTHAPAAAPRAPAKPVVLGRARRHRRPPAATALRERRGPRYAPRQWIQLCQGRAVAEPE